MTSPYDVLAKIRAGRAPQPAGERCEMCTEPIADEHQHVVNVPARQLMCVCRGCYLLFTDQAAQLRYRAVPDRYLALPGARVDLAALQIPVGSAFFFRNSELGRVVAFYPGPAGATESELSLDAWDGVRSAEPRVDLVADDVEAVLVRDSSVFIVPIDACYELVGRLRMLWRGFDGGQEAREFVDDFFAGIAARAKVAP